MPIYDFKCADEECAHEFEKIVGVGVEETTCPICNSKAVSFISQGKRGISFRFNYMER
jgi:putative FmdB family regulatory protein